MKRVKFGTIHADSLTSAEALDEIDRLVAARAGGFIVTPNVDHVVLAQENAELRAAYDTASLSLIDGVPLMWLSRIYGHTFPEKISGSDFVEPLMARAATQGHRVFLLGARPGVGARAAEIWTERYPGLNVVGAFSPELGFEKKRDTNDEVIAKITDAGTEILLVALGCPKQELWMARYADAIAPAVAFGIGASLDFVAGEVKRAPRVFQRTGLEWAYRLAQEPKRMAHRYLVRDRAIVGIAWRGWRKPKSERIFERSRQA